MSINVVLVLEVDIQLLRRNVWVQVYLNVARLGHWGHWISFLAWGLVRVYLLRQQLARLSLPNVYFGRPWSRSGHLLFFLGLHFFSERLVGVWSDLLLVGLSIGADIKRIWGLPKFLLAWLAYAILFWNIDQARNRLHLRFVVHILLRFVGHLHIHAIVPD